MRWAGNILGLSILSATLLAQTPNVTVTNNSLPFGSIGKAYSTQLTATGGSGSYTWSISGTLPPGLNLDAFKGVISGTPTTGGSYAFTVTATDNSSKNSGSKNLSIGILQITTPSPLPGATIGAAYSITFTVADGPAPSAYFWTIDATPPGLAFDQNKGVLSGTPTATGTFRFTVNVFNDSSGASATKAFSLTVASSIAITSASPLPDGDANSPYKITLTVSGGSAPYHWSITAGALPGGITLDPNGGIVSGVPYAVGPSNFTVQVTDSANASAAKAFSLNINPALTVTDSSPLPNGTVGVPYSFTFTVTGGARPYSFSATQVSPFSPSILPSGTSLSAGGTLSGTPDTAGMYTFNLLITDATGSQGGKTFTITITPPLAITTTSPLPNGTTGAAYSTNITASGGTQPYSFTVANPPPGLALSTAGVLSGTPTTAGTFNFIVTVTDSQKLTTSKGFQITIASSAPLLRVAPLSLSFSAPAGGDSPAPQYLIVLLGTGTPANFAVQIDGGAANTAVPPWLKVTPATGAAPARLTVQVDQGSMPTGDSSARIRITVPGDASQTPIDVSVSLHLADVAPHLDIIPTPLRYAARAQAPATSEQTLVVRNSGGGGPINFTTSILNGASWITDVTPGSGQTARNAPLLVRVRVNNQGLDIGSHYDIIRFTSSAGNVDVPVSLFVAGNGPILGLNVTGLRYRARQGAGFSNNQSVKILNFGDPASTVHWTAEIINGADWLTLNPASGTATPAAPGALTLTVNSTATNRTPGGYYALVRVTDPQSRNSPLYIVVVLEIADAASQPLPDPGVGGLFFSGPQPAAQIIAVNTSSAAPVPFQTAATTTDGAAWLTATATQATASTSSPGQVTVAVNTAKLPSTGIFTGEVDIAMSGVIRAVNVTLVFQTSATTTFGPSASPLASCTPSKVALTETGLVNNFAVPAAWPEALIVQLNDDCGAILTGASVSANFSNGDSPLSLRGDGSGTYSTTWQPSSVSTQMTITLHAQAGGLQPATAQVSGGVLQNQAPTLARNGVLHNLNPMIGAALAPATVAQVFGSGLASKTATPGVIPLVTEFNGSFIVVGGSTAPLYFLSDGQVNIEIPNELAPNQQYAVVASANGALTVPDMIDLTPVQPGVAAFLDGHVIAQHSDFSLVDTAHPAKPGEFLLIYLAGMGPTNPDVKSGEPAPSTEPLARVTIQPTVTVNGQQAQIFYAGLTPGFAGLYQINFQLPTNIPSGDRDLVITQNGIQANTTKLPIQ